MPKEQPPIIKIYPGIGNGHELYVWGHALSSVAGLRSTLTNNYLKNAWEMVKRYLIKPAQGIEVRLAGPDGLATATSRPDGFFELHLSHHQLAPGWHTLQVSSGEVQVPTRVYVAPNPKHLVVSDIDDTFLVSHSRNTLKKLWLLLTRNPTTRKPFEGVKEFLNKLKGDDPDEPLIYVSSSEWNLFDFIQSFRDHYGLAQGIFMLQDIKTGIGDLLRSGTGNHRHKQEKIEFLFDLFPDTEFTLVGDSGQLDPIIYRDLAMAHPKQVRKIYIRDLHKSKRELLNNLANELQPYNVELIPFTQ